MIGPASCNPGHMRAHTCSQHVGTNLTHRDSKPLTKLMRHVACEYTQAWPVSRPNEPPGHTVSTHALHASPSACRAAPPFPWCPQTRAAPPALGAPAAAWRRERMFNTLPATHDVRCNSAGVHARCHLVPLPKTPPRLHLDVRGIFQPGHAVEVQARLQVHAPNSAQVGKGLWAAAGQGCEQSWTAAG